MAAAEIAEGAGAAATLLLQQFLSHVERHPEQDLFTFLNDRCEAAAEYTYAEFERHTALLAHALLGQGERLQRGDRVLLVFFPSLDFIVAFVACLRAGLVAVPVFPPNPRRLRKDLVMFASIAQSSGATVALTHSTYNHAKKVADIRLVFGASHWPDLQWLVIEKLVSWRGRGGGGGASQDRQYEAASAALREHLPQPEELAFLQYTSGSTSEPKGVMISHANLGHNLGLIIRELEADDSTVVVSWLPQYHDMGLIGSYLGIMYCGGSGKYMSPLSFIKSPVLWIHAISRYRGTHLQAPNFAFTLSARKYAAFLRTTRDKAPEIDLSSVRHMINAAEPVDEDAILAFEREFGSKGLDIATMFPTYGLAEHCVFVCSGGQQRLCVDKQAMEVDKEIRLVERGTDGSVVIVGCGFPFRGDNVELLIVDPETRAVLSSDCVGEIWIRSPSKAMGYWGLDEQTQEDFHAIPASGYEGDSSGSSGDGFLRTGDLGFLHEEELFVCGRIKDLIIVRGRNHYPQDIERTAERACETELRPGCSAAFPIATEQAESVVLIAECREAKMAKDADGCARIVRTVRTEIAREHGVSLHAIVLLQPRTVPKTTSGKIARKWCLKAYIEDTLESIYTWTTRSTGAGNGSVAGSGAGERKDGSDGAEAQEDAANQMAFGDLEEGADNESENKDDGTGTGVGEAGTGAEAVDSADAEWVRELTQEDALQRLEGALRQAAMQFEDPSEEIPHDVPLISIGMDSMSIAQFKGQVEAELMTAIPDEFVFSELCTMNELAELVRRGHLSEEQEQQLAETMGARQAEGEGVECQNQQPKAAPQQGAPVAVKQPCCPWCTCCY